VPVGDLVPGDRVATATDDKSVVTATEPPETLTGPVMPVMPFPTFEHVPTLPHQQPGNGFESGRDSRAR
jgi:hypothetical protein